MPIHKVGTAMSGNGSATIIAPGAMARRPLGIRARCSPSGKRHGRGARGAGRRWAHANAGPWCAGYAVAQVGSVAAVCSSRCSASALKR